MARRSTRRHFTRTAVAGAAGLLAAGAGRAAGAGAGAATATGARTSAARYETDGVAHIGNSTHVVVLGGVHVLTDPWVKDPADYVINHRVAPAPLFVAPDVVLITHEHDDHFDENALALVDKRATVVVPTWLVSRSRALGFQDVRGMQSGDVLDDVRGLQIEAARALHDIHEITYRFERGGRAVFFGGDTLPTKEINALADRAPVDFAILPADAGALLGKRRVMDPVEARRMAARFGVVADKKGAMLTHHECEVAFPWGVIVDVKPPNAADFPSWYRVPRPGDHFAFPWMTA